MASMGFSHDPGPLPFVTVRDAKWQNRLVELPMPLRIHGLHGCTMPNSIALVTRVDPHDGTRPSIYSDDRPLVDVYLEKPQPCAGAHQWDGEWGTCARCGEPASS